MTTQKRTLGLGSRLALTAEQISREALDRVRAGYAWRKAYIQTRDELTRLTDRELADLGIARDTIKDLAREAADTARHTQ